jgi:hypothetical protein
MVLEERERWVCGFWERKRDFGVRPWETVGRRKERNLIVCGKVYGFICKILRWHYWIGGVLHAVFIEFKLNKNKKQTDKRVI